MKRLIPITVFAALSVLSIGAYAQITVTLTDEGTDTIPCGDPNTFLDGYNGAYGNNENVTITICATPGEGLTVNLSLAAEVGGYFDVHESDTLYVYDGPDASSPLVAVLNNGTAPFGAATANTSLSNLSGCMTLVFISDGTDTGQGFQGQVSCNYSCQPIEPWFSTTPAIVPNDSSGSINICLGDTVVLNALAGFPMSAANNGPGYNQTLENSTIEWFIFGEPTQTGESVTFIPDQRAGYFVDMLITDTLGCFENARTRIQVSTIPSFAETVVLLEDTICPGETTLLLGGVTNQDTVGVDATIGHFLNGGLFGEALELPDGSGTIEDIYMTTINISGFEPDDTISAGSDILSLCISMEHSYLGDLEMWLSCPGGDSITIFNAYNGNSGAPGFIPGGFTGSLGTNFGIPGSGSNQGDCWEYCYSITDNEFGTLGSEFNTNQTGGAATPGTYLPEESFDGFIGCPINGDWTLSVADSWPADDGWICEWGIIFDPDIDPNSESYVPNIVDGWWENDPTIINTIGDTIIEVQPPDPGDYFYTFHVEDDFGCFYDTTLQVHMVPALSSFANEDVCDLEYALSAADYQILGEWSYTGTGAANFDPGPTSYEPNVTVTEYGDYEFIYESDYCGQSDTIVIDFNPTPSPVSLADVTVCPGTDLSFDALNEDIGAEYLWTPGDSTGQIFAIDSILTTTVFQVMVANDCGTSNGSATVTVHTLEVSGPTEVCLADPAVLYATNSTASGTWGYTGPAGSSATFSPSEQDETPSVMVDVEGAYEFVFTDDECALERSWDVVFAPAPTVDILLDTNRICVEDHILIRYTLGTDFYDNLEWSPFGGSMDSLLIAGTDSVAFSTMDTLFHVTMSVSNFCGTDEDEVIYQVVECNLIIPSIFNPDSELGKNAYFHIDALNLHPGNNVKIFSRWGRKMYDQDDYHLNPWDGGKASDGVYYYVLTRPGHDADTGYVHLVRGNS